MQTVSVIVASYRAHDRLLWCVKSLLDQTEKPDEIIVAVDTEDQAEVIRNFFLQTLLWTPIVVASNRTGASEARNAAAARATGDILAFIDDDAVASPFWMATIRRTFQTPSTLVTGGPVWPRYDAGCRYLPSCWWWLIGCTSVNPPTERPISCNMAIRKHTFDEMGGFDADLGRVGATLSIGEETDLIQRIQKKYPLYAVRYCLEAPPVIHTIPKTRTSWGYLLRRAYHEGKGKAILHQVNSNTTESTYLRYMIRHPDRFTVPILTAVAVGYWFGDVL